MSSEFRWVDGPPQPRQSLNLLGGSSENFFLLRWYGSGEPEVVIDKPVFEAAVFAVSTGQEEEGIAILESLGYHASTRTRIDEA